MITKRTFIGFFITSIVLVLLTFGLAKVTGHLSKPIVYFGGSVFMFKNLVFPIKNNLKGLNKLDEREKSLALKILSITSLIFIFTLLILSSIGEFSIGEFRINNIWGHLSFPFFIMIFSIVGYIIILKEEKEA